MIRYPTLASRYEIPSTKEGLSISIMNFCIDFFQMSLK